MSKELAARLNKRLTKLDTAGRALYARTMQSDPGALLTLNRHLEDLTGDVLDLVDRLTRQDEKIKSLNIEIKRRLDESDFEVLDKSIQTLSSLVDQIITRPETVPQPPPSQRIPEKSGKQILRWPMAQDVFASLDNKTLNTHGFLKQLIALYPEAGEGRDTKSIYQNFKMWRKKGYIELLHRNGRVVAHILVTSPH